MNSSEVTRSHRAGGSPANSVSRRRFLAGAGFRRARISAAAVVPWIATRPARAAWRASRDGSDDPLFMSATKLAAWIRDRKISSTEAVKLHIERIRKVDPVLNAVVAECFDRALREAEAADRAVVAGELRGPLHGVPMTIKDSIDTEGVITTGGTQGRAHFVPPKDATVVARLRAAGAILLGKTNTPEFTLGGVAGLATTANILHGMTRNPYDPRYSVYGSSGGAGAIVAAGGASFDIGSDFGGSIRGPSHACGIAGIKPTTGRVPRTGHIVDYGGAFDSYQQLGPMARRVEDLALILPIIAGPDGIDAAIHEVPMDDPDSIPLKGLRVAFYTQQGPGAAGASKEVVEAVHAAARALEDAGCSVTEDVPPRLMELIELRRNLTRADGHAWQKRLVEKHGTTVPGPARELDLPQAPVREFVEMLERQDEIKTEILTFMEGYDLLVCPVRSTPVPRIGDPEKLGDLPGASFTSPFNVTGYPAGVVRGGTCRNHLPIGVQVVGRPWADATVLAAMSQIERATGGYQRTAL